MITLINIKNGNLLEATEDIIGHQVNCRGVMGSGVAKQIRSKYPGVFSKYTDLVSHTVFKISLLGECQLCHTEDGAIANLFGQDGYGKNGVHTDYTSLYHALCLLHDYCKECGKSVALPYGMGCGLGGGDWNVVYDIIHEVFSDYEVTLYKL